MMCKSCGKAPCMCDGGMYAEGGNVRSGKDRHENEKGVHPRSFSKQGGGESDAGAGHRSNMGMKRGGRFDRSDAIKDEHRQVLSDSRSLPKPKLQGLAKGGEVEPMHESGHDEDMSGIDDELMDMAAGECMEAFEKKDKKGLLDALKAIILSCRE